MDDIDVDSLVTTNCGHHFHANCIESCLEHKVNCPLCRTDITLLQTPRTLLSNTVASAARARRLAAEEREAIKRARKEIARERRRRRSQREAAAAALHRAQVQETIAAMRAQGFRHDDGERRPLPRHRRRRRRINDNGGL